MSEFRILSLDGAGIYGLTQALWLRQLCTKYPDFLGKVDLFAGCSAGAINSLLLANADDPHKFVCEGELEEYWRRRGTFSNSDPVAAWLNLFGIGALGSAEDFLSLLRSYFHDDKLKDLKRRVLITTFNWGHCRADCSRPRAYPRDRCQDPWQWPATLLGEGFRPATVGAPPKKHGVGPDGRLWPAYTKSQEGQYESWGPNIFTNLFFEDAADEKASSQWSLVDVAYGAASPPGLRPIRYGLSDGAQFGADPVVNAIGAKIQLAKNKLGQNGLEVLPDIAALSLGTGCQQPYYWLENFNLSSMQFGMLPTNPWLGSWSPPSAAVFLEAPDDNTTLIAQELLGEQFLRLDPGILRMSAGSADLVASNPLGQQWMIDQIEAAVRRPRSKRAVQHAGEYLEAQWGLEAATASTV